MATILILSNSLNGLILFRGELIIELLKKNYKILISANKDVTIIPFQSKNLYFINSSFDRRSTRVLSNLRLFFNYLSIVIKHKPNLLITYTIKPNIYGGIISRIFNLKHIATITGLGSAFQKISQLKRLVSFLYKISFKKSNVVFFQNSYNYKLFQKLKIFAKKQLVIPT
jgi:galacturonosyltransferase